MDNKYITKKVMEEYETLRRLGPTNMLDRNGVQNYAKLLKLNELAKFAKDRHNYIDLISNFSYYMKKYEIKQDS